MSKRYKDLPLKEVKELLKKLPPNVKIRVYYGNEEEQVLDVVNHKKHKPTLTHRVDHLEERMDRLEERMDRIETKLDRIGDALFEFIRTTNERFDRIDTRLDYIVKANNLKDLPRK